MTNRAVVANGVPRGHFEFDSTNQSKYLLRLGINLINLFEIIVRKLIAQWSSGLKWRLNEVRYHFDKFNQVIARYLEAQHLNGLNFKGYMHTKRKAIDILLLVHSMAKQSIMVQSLSSLDYILLTVSNCSSIITTIN